MNVAILVCHKGSFLIFKNSFNATFSFIIGFNHSPGVLFLPSIKKIKICVYSFCPFPLIHLTQNSVTAFVTLLR